MIQEYNTHTHTHMCIRMFFHLHCPSLQYQRLHLLVLWQHQSDHYRQPTGVLSNYPDENIIIMENTISDIIIKSTICNINYIPMQKYHIIIYNIKLYKKWLTVIHTKRERERITKRKKNRLREWTKERKQKFIKRFKNK